MTSTTLDLLEEKCATPTTTTVLDFSPVTNLSSEPPPYYRNRYSSTEYSAALRDFYDLLFDEQFAMCTAWWDTPDNEWARSIYENTSASYGYAWASNDVLYVGCNDVIDR